MIYKKAGCTMQARRNLIRVKRFKNEKLTLFPGQAIKTPAIDIATMLVGVQCAFKSTDDIDQMLVSGSFQCLGGFNRTYAGAA